MIVVAITGASGVIYGIRLLEALKELNIENSLVISDAAKIVIESETDYAVEDVIKLADTHYDFNDLTASINSGSFKADALAIVPCSMKTLSSIANGYIVQLAYIFLISYFWLTKEYSIFLHKYS